MPRIGPGRKAGYQIELPQDTADELVGFVLLTQLVKLGHDLRERAFDVADGALRIVLALRVQAALTSNEFFAVEIRKGMQDAIARRRRIGQEAGQTVPQRWHLPRFEKFSYP